MATRGAIVRATGTNSFAGAYHHWDSYPTSLGSTLWNLYHERYKKDLDAMLKELIDDHPAGWSTINDADWNQSPGYTEYKDTTETEEKQRPQCYCHGDRRESANVVTEKTAANVGCEYVYAFGEENERPYMLILSSYVGERKMIGMFGMGDPDATWHILAKIMLNSEEPDWSKIEQKETDSE